MSWKGWFLVMLAVTALTWMAIESLVQHDTKGGGEDGRSRR